VDKNRLNEVKIQVLDEYQDDLEEWKQHHDKYYRYQIKALCVLFPALFVFVGVPGFATLRYFLSMRLPPEEVPKLSINIWTFALGVWALALCALLVLGVLLRYYAVIDRAAFFRSLNRNGQQWRTQIEHAQEKNRVTNAKQKLAELRDDRNNRFPPNEPFDEAVKHVLSGLSGVFELFKGSAR
jgi:hypothetical protein